MACCFFKCVNLTVVTFSTCFIHSINNHNENSEVSFIFSVLCYFFSSQPFRSYVSHSLPSILIFMIRVISNSNGIFNTFMPFSIYLILIIQFYFAILSLNMLLSIFLLLLRFNFASAIVFEIWIVSILLFYNIFQILEIPAWSIWSVFLPFHVIIITALKFFSNIWDNAAAFL